MRFRPRSNAASCRLSASIRWIRSPVQPLGPAGRPPASAERLRCLPGAGIHSVRAQSHQLAADRHHGLQFRRLSRDQLRSRHPDLVTYAVSMSGAFDIPQRFLDGYYDQNAYFTARSIICRSLSDQWFLEHFRRNYYVLAVGNQRSAVRSECEAGACARRQAASRIVLDVWEGFGHDWPWWYKWRRSFSL